MNDKYFEETISQIYEMVENAKGVTFSQDKCAVDRNVMITLYVRQQKRHRCIEQSFGLCGRGRGWDDLGE